MFVFAECRRLYGYGVWLCQWQIWHWPLKMVWWKHHPWAGLPGNDSGVIQTAKMIQIIVSGKHCSFLFLSAHFFNWISQACFSWYLWVCYTLEHYLLSIWMIFNIIMWFLKIKWNFISIFVIYLYVYRLILQILIVNGSKKKYEIWFISVLQILFGL